MNRNSFLNIIKTHLFNYPTSYNINYMWGFGSSTGFFLLSQLITGTLIATQYNADGFLAFENIEYIMRSVKNGWFIRYLHSNGASMFFICLYLHIFRGLYYKSYLKPRAYVWISGVLILFISIMVAFLGYILPWGQMSFWGATVITNLLTAIPVLGNYIVIGLWGSFSIINLTLIRFYVFHYLLAILLVILIIMHISLLHVYGSSNPSIIFFKEKIKFSTYFLTKDLSIFNFFLILFCFLIFYEPNVLGHTDNYIKANPLATPTHIVPEWYFLPFYAISRSIDNKLLGVLIMLFSILIIASLVFFKEFNKKNLYGFENNCFFWILFICILVLWFIGSLPAEQPYITYGKFFTILYFLNFIFYYIYLQFLNNSLFFVWNIINKKVIENIKLDVLPKKAVESKLIFTQEYGDLWSFYYGDYRFTKKVKEPTMKAEMWAFIKEKIKSRFYSWINSKKTV